MILLYYLPLYRATITAVQMAAPVSQNNGEQLCKLKSAVDVSQLISNPPDFSGPSSWQILKQGSTAVILKQYIGNNGICKIDDCSHFRLQQIGLMSAFWSHSEKQ
jgi:hypothetical protein